MSRLAGWMLSIVGLAAAAVAQTSVQPVQWLNQPSAAEAAAKRSTRPILVYVSGDAESRASDLDREQQRVLRDPLVIEVINARFVPLRLARSSNIRATMEQLGLPFQLGQYMAVLPPEAFSSPETSTKLALIQPMQIAQASALLTALTQAYHTYGDKLYADQIRPVFEAEEFKSQDVQRGLKVIEDLLITSADGAIIKLLEKHGDDKRLAKPCYDALAMLSTKAAAEHLWKQAKAGVREAQAALANLTPDAAETLLLPELRADDAETRNSAYQALAKVFRLKPVRPARWWENAKEKMIADEIEKVSKQVQDDAQRWRETVGKIR